MAKTKVLITGMSGLIGGALRRHLGDRYELTALNRSEVSGVRCHRADIRDATAISSAFEGQDVVVHLAAMVTGGARESAMDDMVQFNLIGTHNVFEAARTAGCKRVVFASSGATVAGYEDDEPYKTLVTAKAATVKPGWPMLTHESAVRPRGLYGCSKVWGETLARRAADAGDLSVICVRIGRVTDNDRADDARTRAVWCSHRDICALLEAAMVAPPSLKYDIVFGCSNNRFGYRDLEHSKAALGWQPQDSADGFFKD